MIAKLERALFVAALLSAHGAAADLPAIEVPTLAGGPSFEKPALHVGDRYEFATNAALVPCRRWEIKATNDQGRVLSTCETFRSYLSADHDYNPIEVRDELGAIYASFKPYYPQLKFPLRIGAQWSGTYEGYTKSDGDWQGDLNCEVKDWSTVNVAAGSFQAYRVQCLDRVNIGPMTSAMNITLWYAPAVRAVVKSDNADDPRWDMELRKVELKR